MHIYSYRIRNGHSKLSIAESTPTRTIVTQQIKGIPSINDKGI